MAFVNEEISSEEDKERFNSFGFISKYTRKLIEPDMWTIDHERDIFLCSLDGVGNRRAERPCFLVLVIKGVPVYITTYIEGHGDVVIGKEIV